MTTSPTKKRNTADETADRVRQSILTGDLAAGTDLPPERELATRLGVSRATLSQALVALEVVGVVAVRHGDGTVLTDQLGSKRIIDAIRAHADRMPEVIEARDALETKLAALAALRRTDADVAAINASLERMERDIEAGGRGVDGDELFHGAVTAAAYSPLLAQMMATIRELIVETRIESLSQPGRPRDSLAGHRKVADAIIAGDPDAAAAAMHEHVVMVSDVALLRERPAE